MTRRDRSTSSRAPIPKCASSITSRTAATAARCAAGSRRPRASWSSTPTATRSTIRREMEALWQRVRATTSIWSTATRSAARIRCTASSSAAIYHHTVKLLFGLQVRDVDCDFRLMRRSIFERVTLEKNSGVICLEMMKKIHGRRLPDRRSAGAPLSSRLRPVAVLQLPPALRTAIDVVKLWFDAGHPPRASRRRRAQLPIPPGSDRASGDRRPRTTATSTAAAAC